MSNRKIDVVVLKLTNQEYDAIEKIIANSNKMLERSRQKAKEKREKAIEDGNVKERKETSYRRQPISLDDYISIQEKIRVGDLKQERAKWRNPEVDESVSDHSTEYVDLN